MKKMNNNLNKAKRVKNDEFYTQITDIERELRHYHEQFENKVVFCNCDDPEWSNFWRYFSLNFDYLGLKRLIATHFEPDRPSYKLEMIRGEKALVKTPLKQNGDFRSPECLDLLQECDIVVTNPPFSLFREYIDIICQSGKKFLIIGNHNAITYKEVFYRIMNNEIWLGVSPRSMNFLTPEGKLVAVNANWYTNMDHRKRHEPFQFYRKYAPAHYPKYDNYDAIEVSKVSDIPEDYAGFMGVPITFLEKYNSDQFEIVGCSDRARDGSIDFLCLPHPQKTTPVINGKNIFKRLFIRNKNPKN